MTIYKSTVIKGIACLMILLSHMEQLFEMLGGRTNVILQLFHPLGFLGVGLFLSVSGYGTMVSYRRKGADWRGGVLKSRITKIAPPLLIATLFFVCADILLNGRGYSVAEIFLNGMGINCNIARFTWYILFQYIWYIVFVIGEKVGGKWIVPYYTGVVILLMLIGMNSKDVRFQCEMWLMNLLNFPYGIVLANDDGKIHSPKSVWVPFVIFLGLFAMNYLVLRNPGAPMLYCILRSGMALFFAMAVLNMDFLEKKNSVTKILNLIGTFSFEIYLTHGFVIFLLGNLFAGAPMGIVFPTVAVFTAVASVLLRKIVEILNKAVIR